jgi:hypothetical protein
MNGGKKEVLSNGTRLPEDYAMHGVGVGYEHHRVGSRKANTASAFLIFIKHFLFLSLLFYSNFKCDSNCCFIQDSFLKRKNRFRIVLILKMVNCLEIVF